MLLGNQKLDKKTSSRTRNANAEEITRRLRSVGEYLAEMMKHEKSASDAAADAAKTKNFEIMAECARLFARDFESFISHARTAWNYLNQVADAAGSREWLNSRLDSNLFRFHRDLANQDTHKYAVAFGVRQTVNVKGVLPAIRMFPGQILPQSIPFQMNVTVTGLVSMAYQYNPKNLEPDVAELCVKLLKQYSNETVIESGARYFDGLNQAFRSGERKGRFFCKSIS